VWLYASENEEAVLASVEALPIVVRELGIGSGITKILNGGGGRGVGRGAGDNLVDTRNDAIRSDSTQTNMNQFLSKIVSFIDSDWFVRRKTILFELLLPKSTQTHGLFTGFEAR